MKGDPVSSEKSRREKQVKREYHVLCGILKTSALERDTSRQSYNIRKLVLSLKALIYSNFIFLKLVSGFLALNSIFPLTFFLLFPSVLLSCFQVIELGIPALPGRINILQSFVC